MVTDFHTHCWPDDLAQRALEALCEHMPKAHAHTDGTQSGLASAMDAAGVDRAVVLPVATKPSQVATINRVAIESGSERFIHFGALHPACEDPAADVALLASGGVKGIKLHPEYQDFYVDDPSLDRLYTPLQEAGLVVVFHAGWDPGPFTRDHATPAALRRVHERYPRLKMVAAHMGGFMMCEEVRRELCGLPVWLDTSAAPEFLDPAQFVELVRDHGADRVLFGSDSPWFDMTHSCDWLRSLPLSNREREAIMGNNAAQLLEL